MFLPGTCGCPRFACAFRTLTWVGTISRSESIVTKTKQDLSHECPQHAALPRLAPKDVVNQGTGFRRAGEAPASTGVLVLLAGYLVGDRLAHFLRGNCFFSGAAEVAGAEAAAQDCGYCGLYVHRLFL